MEELVDKISRDGKELVREINKLKVSRLGC
jgi:hypothetical protein